MTIQSGSDKHCGHEQPCRFANGMDAAINGNACVSKNCLFDTRTTESTDADWRNRRVKCPHVCERVCLENVEEHDARIAADAVEKVLEDAWKKFNTIVKYEHADPSDREYSGGERIVALCGSTESIYSVLQSLRINNEGERP